MRPSPISPRQARAALDVFTGLVIASVAVALAGLTWRAVAWLSPAEPAVLAGTGTIAPAPALDVTPLIALAPFGAVAGGASTPTTLPIELKGILLTVPRSQSTALIAPTGQAAVATRVGGAVPGGGTVAEIALDHVVLAVGGQRQLLAFPRPGAPAGAAPLPIAGSPVSGAPVPPPPTAAPPPPAAAAALAASPQGLLDSLGAAAVPGGYRVGETLSPQLRQAGLRPGDTILALNGQPLGQGAADQQLLAAAARSGSVAVEISRGDSRMTLSFPFR